MQIRAVRRRGAMGMKRSRQNTPLRLRCPVGNSRNGGRGSRKESTTMRSRMMSRGKRSSRRRNKKEHQKEKKDKNYLRTARFFSRPKTSRATTAAGLLEEKQKPANVMLQKTKNVETNKQTYEKLLQKFQTMQEKDENSQMFEPTYRTI